MIARVHDTDPSHFIFNDMIKKGLMVHDRDLWVNGTSPGYYFIGDATGVTFGHVARLNLVMIQKFINYIQEGFPERLLAIHIINTSPIVEVIFNMLKPFVKEAILKLVRLLLCV